MTSSRKAFTLPEVAGGILLLFAIIGAIFFMSGCITTSETERSAEANAREFAGETGLELDGVACSGRDSDGDGYVSCTLVFPSGEMKAVECGYNIPLAIMGQNTSCKIATPMTVIQQ